MDLSKVIKKAQEKENRKVVNVGISKFNHDRLSKLCNENNIKIRTFVNSLIDEYFDYIEKENK